jgi:hypothetical protein
MCTWLAINVLMLIAIVMLCFRIPYGQSRSLQRQDDRGLSSRDDGTSARADSSRHEQ